MVLSMLLMITMSLLFTGCSKDSKSADQEKKADKYVELVKNGSMESVPNVKIGEAFAAFFVNGAWKSFEAEDKSRVVEFNGGLTWKKKPAQCTMQFLIKDDKSFKLGALAINDVELPLIESMAVLEKILKGDKKSVEKGDGSIEVIQKQINEADGIKGTVIATSAGHSSKGSLSLIKNQNGKYVFVLIDEGNHRMATINYNEEAYNFVNTKKNNNPLSGIVRFNLYIYNDTKDADANAGEWYGGKNHTIPIYAAYDTDRDGNIVPGMLNTGKGFSPSHYHGYLNEQKNVDLANLFLTEMESLHKNVKENNLSL